MTKNATKDFGLSNDDYLRSSLLRFRNGQLCKMKTRHVFTSIGKKRTSCNKYDKQGFFVLCLDFILKRHKIRVVICNDLLRYCHILIHPN